MLHKKSCVFISMILLFTFGKAGEVSLQKERLVPTILNYQGYLTDTLDVPIDDSLDMTFKIFDAASAGNELWSETQTDVSVERGVFSVLLGETTPIPDSVFEATDRWLELTLEGPHVLSPRTRITAVGYAYTSTYSDTAEYARVAVTDTDWTISGNDMYSGVSGNIGIGTPNPGAKLHVDNGDIYLRNGGLGFVPSGGGPADLVFYRGGTGFGILRRYDTDYTLMQIWAPPDAQGSNEATLALVRGDEPNQEFVDIYNNGYVSETQYGIRIQKRGTGQYRDFVIDYYDGTTKSEVMRIQPSGNVGINTPSPSHTLEVTGNVHVEGDITWQAETSYVSIPAAAFTPYIMPGTEWVMDADGRWFYTTSSSFEYYFAPVQLPHNATITKVTFYWYDVHSAIDLTLLRAPMAGTSVEPMAFLSSESSGYGSDEQTSILYPTINNAQYIYYFYLYMPYIYSDDTRYRSAVIQYVTTKPY
jgi:hypothetical protein